MRVENALQDVYKRQPHNDTLDNQVVPVRLGDFNEDGTALQGMVLL